MTIQDKTTYRHPRTLQEAFGPYTSRDVIDETGGNERYERIGLIVAILVICIVLVAVAFGVTK